MLLPSSPPPTCFGLYPLRWCCSLDGPRVPVTHGNTKARVRPEVIVPLPRLPPLCAWCDPPCRPNDEAIDAATADVVDALKSAFGEDQRDDDSGAGKRSSAKVKTRPMCVLVEPDGPASRNGRLSSMARCR